MLTLIETPREGFIMKKQVAAFAIIGTLLVGALAGCAPAATSTSSAASSSSQGISSAASSISAAADDVIITENQAIDIALGDAGLALNQVADLTAKLDTDSGVKEWDVNFTYQNREFDYEIDATNGNILDNDVDID